MTADPARRHVVAAIVVAAAVAGLAAAAGTGVRATASAATSGDEPHYLLTAVSLAEDGDLDVADEMARERYRPFHQPALRPQGRVDERGRMVVPHDPLLPALLAPSLAAGGYVGAKLTLSLMAVGLAGMLVWTAVRRLRVRPATAVVTVTVLTSSAPLAAYGSQVYPELPAALALACAAAALTGPLGRGGLAATLAAVVALPWLSVKYIPVAAALALVGGVRMVRAGRAPLAGWCAALLAAAGTVWLVAHMAWYGGITVYAAGSFFAEHGGQAAVLGTDPNYLGRTQRLLGLLVDREFGIAAWQPAWLLVVPAIAALMRHRPRWWPVVAAPALAGWLTAAFVAATMHGWWFPGRQVVVALPLLVLAVAWWVDRGHGRRLVVAALGVLGVATWVWLVIEGWQGRVTMVIDFAGTTNPWYRAWRLLLPDYARLPAGTWVLHGVWLAALVGVAMLGWRAARRREPPPSGPRPPRASPRAAGSATADLTR